MGLILSFPVLVWSQTNGLQGGDIPLTGALPGDQVSPAAAFGAGGGFFTWHDNITDPFGLGVSARRLNAALQPVGEVIHVNQTIGNDQERPKIEMLNDGGAVIVFQSGRPGLQNVLARFLTAAGGFATDEVLVNNAALKAINKYTTNWTFIRNNHVRVRRQVISEKVGIRQEFNANPVVAVLNDSSVIVAWSSSRIYTTNSIALSEQLSWDDQRQLIITNRVRVPYNVRVAGMQDVYLQRLSATGQKLSGEFRANQFTDLNQRDASISPLDNGGFVVAWASEQPRTNTVPVDIYARLFDAAGSAVSDEFCVSTDATRACGTPSVAGTPGGGFTIAWAQRSESISNGMDVVARVFSAGGVAVGGAFAVNTFTYGDQFAPSVASLGTQQVVTWSSMGQDGSWEGVYARAFNGATALGDEFRVNVSTPNSQKHPRIATDRAGRALVLWSGYGLDGSGFNLFGRTYTAP